MSEFWGTLKNVAGKLNCRSTGSLKGHVLTVEPGEDSKEGKQILSELLGLLGGGLVAAGLLIFRTLRGASTSQALGVYKAAPVTGSTLIGLFGYCMEGRKDEPTLNEEFNLAEAGDLPVDKVSQIISRSDERFSEFIDDYYFLEKLGTEPFKEEFKQTGIWVITDDIGFIRVRRELFPDIMLFTTGTMEILFWLRRVLQDVIGEDVRKFRFDKELVGAFELNHALGFITDDLYKDWQSKFGFTITNLLK